MPLTPVISATTQWLLTAYPAPGGAMGSALAEAQARQAVTVASWLRYPTTIDAELVTLLGPGGSAELDAAVTAPAGDHPWRAWVDEVVASWAACLLSEDALALQAVRAATETEHSRGLSYEFKRLVAPDHHDRMAAVLLRHRDLLSPVAALHRSSLLDRLGIEALEPDALDAA